MSTTENKSYVNKNLVEIFRKIADKLETNPDTIIKFHDKSLSEDIEDGIVYLKDVKEIKDILSENKPEIIFILGD